MTSPWFICGKDIKGDVTSVSCNLVFWSLFCCCCWLSCFFCKWYKDKRSCPSKKDVLSDEELQLFSSSIIFSIFLQPTLFLGSNIIYIWEVHYEITIYYIGLQITNESATTEKNHTQFHYDFCKCQEYLM